MKSKTQMAFRVLSAAESESLQIDVYEAVGDSWFGGVTAKDVLEKLKASDSIRKINVRINSGGGDVFDGVAIYNLLREHRAKVTIDIDGLAASIASIIAMAGDKIRIAENAMVMIHDPWMFTMGNADELRKDIDLLEKVGQQLATTYAARTGQSLEQVREWMNATTWMTATEALERGFVDEITPAKDISASWDLSRYDNVPNKLRGMQLAAALISPLDMRPPASRSAANPETDPAPAVEQAPPTTPPAAQLGGEPPKDQNDMKTVEQLQAELEQMRNAHAAELSTIQSSLVSAGVKFEPGKALTAVLLVAAVATLVTERDEAKKNASDANDKLIENEVDALVGNKITPAERNDFVALAKSNKGLFDSMVASRPDLGMVGERRAVDNGAPPPATDGNDNSGGLSAAAEKRARGAA